MVPSNLEPGLDAAIDNVSDPAKENRKQIRVHIISSRISNCKKNVSPADSKEVALQQFKEDAWQEFKERIKGAKEAY